MHQFTVVEAGKNRGADLVVFFNGLPVALLELKNPGDAHATLRGPWNQVQTYRRDVPALFTPNALVVIRTGRRRRWARSPRAGIKASTGSRTFSHPANRLPSSSGGLAVRGDASAGGGAKVLSAFRAHWRDEHSAQLGPVGRRAVMPAAGGVPTARM